MKAAYKPIGLLAGVLAGIVGKRVFTKTWAAVGGGEPPTPKDAEVSWGKLVAALVIEGALMRVLRGAVDHAIVRAANRDSNA
jgi:hypothetical protein